MIKTIFYVSLIAHLTACHGAPYTIPMQKADPPGDKSFGTFAENAGSSGGFLMFAMIPLMKNDML